MKNKLILNSGAIIVFLGVFIFPILLDSNIIKEKLIPVIKIYSDSITPKTYKASQLVAIDESSDPEKKSKMIKKEFEEPGLDVDLRRQNNGWLLSTNLNKPNTKRRVIYIIMKEHSFQCPIGSTQFDLFFVKQ